MSPLTKTRKNVKRTEWSVRGKGKSEDGTSFGNSYAKVKMVSNSVQVTWLDDTLCAQRSFTSHDLKELLLLIDGAKRYPDVWFRTRDQGAKEFYFQLGEDGRLTANNVPVFHGSVDWDDLKHAFEEALSELDSDEEGADEA